MLQHLHSNGLLPEHQSAYRRSHSTETALLKVTSDALIAADQGRLTLLGMLDLSVAFDCVDHGILLSRLETSDSLVWCWTGCGRTLLVGNSTWGTTGQHPRRRSWSTAFLKAPYSVLCISSSTQQMRSKLPESWVSSYTVSSIYDHCLACDTSQLTNRLTHCIEVIGRWMSSNRLRLNASKTEFIWLGSTRRLARCTFDPIIINGDTILPSLTVRDLGAYIDSGINFDEHVTRLTRTCFFHIRQLRSIRRSLTIESSHALVRALVLSRLDYCNGLLGGAPKCLLGPLSGVLRAAARLILLLPRSGSVTDRIRTELHWLDIPSRVAFKLCVLAYRCIHGSAPSFLARFFTPVSVIAGRSQLRSASTGVLFVPRSHTLTIGPRAFAISAPSAWNRLPADLRDPSHSLLTFRKKLKTFLFNAPV